MSQALLVENNINAKSLKSFDYLGRHDKVARALITKSHDAGAIKSSTYKKLCDPKEIIVVRAFSNVTKPWIASSDLPKEICDAITASLMSLESQEVVGELGCSGFSETTSAEYDLVREGMKKSEAFNPHEEEN